MNHLDKTTLTRTGGGAFAVSLTSTQISDVSERKSFSARDSAFELMRIVCLLMIVSHHFVVHGGTFDQVATPSLHTFIRDAFTMNGKVGVDGFVLISGYFLCESRGGWVRRIVRLCVQTTTFALGILLVLWMLGKWHPTPIDILSSTFPLVFNVWWFASSYLGLLVVAPLLVAALHNLSRETHRAVLVGGLVLFSILPTVTNQNSWSSNLAWFCYLFLLASYVRRYFSLQKGRWWAWLGLTAFSYLVAVGMAERLMLHTVPAPWNKLFTMPLNNVNWLPTFVAAFGLFMAFRAMHIRRMRVINLVASSTFGIYLIHDQPHVRNLLWGWLAPSAHFKGSGFYPYALVCVVGVFCAASAIALVHEQVIMRLFDMSWRKAVEKKQQSHTAAIEVSSPDTVAIGDHGHVDPTG